MENEMRKRRDVILALWFSVGEDWLKMYRAIEGKARVDVDGALKGIDRGAYVTIIDDDYPEICKSFNHPPFVLDRELAEWLASETSGSDDGVESEG